MFRRVKHIGNRKANYFVIPKRTLHGHRNAGSGLNYFILLSGQILHPSAMVFEVALDGDKGDKKSP